MATNKNFDKSVECSICLEEFKDPRILPCAHTFCRACLQLQMIIPIILRREYQCPICRASHNLPSHGVDDIPKNFYITEMMEINSAIKSRHPVCTEHQPEDLRFYCLHCKTPICRDCKIVSHEGHKTDMVSKIAKENKASVRTLLSDIEKGIKRLNEHSREHRRIAYRETGRAVYLEETVQQKTKDLHDMIDLIVKETKKIIGNWKNATTQTDDAFKRTLNGTRMKLEEHKKVLSSALEENDDGTAIFHCNSILKSRASIKRNIELPPLPNHRFISQLFLHSFNKLHKTVKDEIESFRQQYDKGKFFTPKPESFTSAATVGSSPQQPKQDLRWQERLEELECFREQYDKEKLRTPNLESHTSPAPVGSAPQLPKFRAPKPESFTSPAPVDTAPQQPTQGHRRNQHWEARKRQLAPVSHSTPVSSYASVPSTSGATGKKLRTDITLI